MSGYEEDKIRKNGIEEDAFNEESRSNGVEEDAFNEEMAGDDQIKDALDTIEPSAGAKERMLANIRKKAAAAETAGSGSAAPASPVRIEDEMIKAEERPVKAEPAEAPKKKSAARTWMWVVPALATVAAAVVILYVAGAFPKGKKEKLDKRISDCQQNRFPTNRSHVVFHAVKYIQAQPRSKKIGGNNQ